MSEKNLESDIGEPIGSETTDVNPAVISIGKNIRLFPDQPLPDYDIQGAQAFKAVNQQNSEESLFVRVCEPGTYPRVSLIRQAQTLTDVPLMRPVEWGPVDWPGADGQRFAIVFPLPKNGPLMLSHTDRIKSYSADSITKDILGSLTGVLSQLSKRGMVHHAIRPENMYHIGEGHGPVVLGECFSSPPGACQPVVYETIEMGMTPPLNRGNGSRTDDFYALGASLLTLSMGHCPAAKFSDRAVIEAKLHKGSYTALMAGEKPSFGLRELLRGLLTDDPAHRWGLEELEQWSGGVLHASVQEIRTELTDRPFSFEGSEYRDTRTLAYAFGESWSRAEVAIRSESFAKWVQRSVVDEKVVEGIKEMLEADSDVAASPGLLAAQASMIMDRTAPVRFKTVVVMPSGLGPPLARAFMKKDAEAIMDIKETVSGTALFDWYDSQSEMSKLEFEPEINELKQVQALLRHDGPGYGIERCLYVLNRSLPCLSPIMGDRYLDTLRGLLQTLEDIVTETGELQILVDRHLPAYIAARISGNLDRQLIKLEHRKEEFAPRLAMIEILARLQNSLGPEELPNLTRWLAKELEPAVSRLKSRKRRVLAEKNLEIAANSGNLTELNKTLNNQAVLKRDEGERRRAEKELKAAIREIVTLESSEFLDSAQRTGWRIASMISGFSAVMAFIMIILL